MTRLQNFILHHVEERPVPIGSFDRRWLCKHRIPFGGAYVPCALSSGHEGNHIPEKSA